MTFHSTVLARLSVVLSLFLASVCSAQTVALTFNDGMDERQAAWAHVNGQLLKGLEKSGIKAALFPSLKHTGSRMGLKMVADWGKAGHMIGNHTASHFNLSRSDIRWEVFVRDVEEAAYVLSHVPGYVRMLRFPYLDEGDTMSKISGVRRWMKSNGYRNAPASIEASDWYYGMLYDEHVGVSNAKTLEKFRKYYVAHLLARAGYYDALARRVLKRSPPHVLVLHTNRLNADTLPAIVAAFRSKGWRIIPASKAFADPLYAQQPNLAPAGGSIIWQLAVIKKIPGLRYPAERSAYEVPGLKAAGLLTKGEVERLAARQAARRQ